MTNAPIRILLVEDRFLLRLALRTTMELRAELRIVAETDRGAEALDLCRRHQPDVAVVDLGLAGMSGLEVLEAVRREWPSIRLIALSDGEESGQARRALGRGAEACLPADAGAEELVSAVLSAGEGRRG